MNFLGVLSNMAYILGMKVLIKHFFVVFLASDISSILLLTRLFHLPAVNEIHAII